MKSPCLKEVSPHPHGCCPTTPFFGSPEPLNKVSKSRSGSTSAACRRDFAATTTSSLFPDTQFTNHESLPSLQESFAEFRKTYPQYYDTRRVDHIRAQEFYHLSLSKHTCLDYFGIGIFSYNQLQEEEDSSSRYQTSSQLLDIPFFSVSYKTGNLKTQLLHGGQESKLDTAMKKRIMNFLNISENDYSMVFTANRSSAFKLVAESYPFQSSQKLLTVYDYESEAVQAMISTSEKKGARGMSAEFTWPRLRIHSEKMRKMVVSKKKKKKERGLFVFPLHSRITGVRYPYQWMRIAQENGWHILIDACALGPKDMDSFGLSLFRPDFVVCSFYKIFGENPSGFGCLFVKKSTVPILEADTSAGMVSLLPATKQMSMEEFSRTDTQLKGTSTFKLQADEAGASVDASNAFSGPLSFRGMQSGKLEQGGTSEVQKAAAMAKPDEMQFSRALKLGTLADFIQQGDTKTNGDQRTEIKCRGLDQVDSLGLTTITSRARCLINWLVNALMKLQHPNTEGIALVKIYGPKIKFDRGPALAFNVFDWKGEKVEPVLVQKLADRRNISLSYAFLQHIVFLDKYQKEKDQVIEKKVGEAKGMAENKRKGKTEIGITVVTASLSFLANFEDIYRLWVFVAQFLDADFVEKARWRYTALNQKTIEV